MGVHLDSLLGRLRLVRTAGQVTAMLHTHMVNILQYLQYCMLQQSHVTTVYSAPPAELTRNAACSTPFAWTC